MNKLFLNDFYARKYAAEVKALEEQEEADHGARRRALEECATEIERRDFLSKKTAYLRYKTQYGATHEEAQEMFFGESNYADFDDIDLDKLWFTDF